MCFIVDWLYRYFGNAQKIIEYPNASIYLGNAAAATNNQFVTKNKIQVILNVTPHKYHYPNIPGLRIIQKPHLDSAEHASQKRMFQSFPELVNIVKNAVQDNKNILIHCKAGVNRSPSVLVAYLMTHHNLTVQKAIDLVKKYRSCIYFFGNNFECALQWYQKYLIYEKNIP